MNFFKNDEDTTGNVTQAKITFRNVLSTKNPFLSINRMFATTYLQERSILNHG